MEIVFHSATAAKNEAIPCSVATEGFSDDHVSLQAKISALFIEQNDADSALSRKNAISASKKTDAEKNKTTKS